MIFFDKNLLVKPRYLLEIIVTFAHFLDSWAVPIIKSSTYVLDTSRKVNLAVNDDDDDIYFLALQTIYRI